jgi:hypothetical protein
VCIRISEWAALTQQPRPANKEEAGNNENRTTKKEEDEKDGEDHTNGNSNSPIYEEYGSNVHNFSGGTNSIVLPGMFCDEFSQCGKGAKCVGGVCKCSTQGHHLAFVNGTTMCVGIVEEVSVEDVGWEKEEEKHKYPQSFKIVPARRLKQMDDAVATATLRANIGVGIACTYSHQCHPNLTCFDGVCTCMESSQRGGDACAQKSVGRRDAPRDGYLFGEMGKEFCLMTSPNGN